MSAPRKLLALVALATVSSVLPAAQAQTDPASPPASAQASQQSRNDYGATEAWLCRPGRKDACAADLTTTIVAANGKLQREAFKARGAVPVDCFYVYPTVSRDTTGNSDMKAGPEETSVIQQQFARFAGTCRQFAPLYRQLTLAGLIGTIAGNMIAFDDSLGYNDIVDAWNYYLEHDNNGRGVVLIGHSQGAAILEQLVRREIEGKPVQARLISALLLGTTITVPKNADVGGTFKNVPLCRLPGQTGCVITYASFRATVPPPDNSRFARVADTKLMAACTNPAALGGGRGELRAYLTTMRVELGATLPPVSWTTPPQPIDTPFVSVPGLLSAQCVNNQYGSYLEIKLDANPADPRTDQIAGDVISGGQPQTMWGLHLIDVNLAMGNLLDIVATQSKAYLAKKKM